MSATEVVLFVFAGSLTTSVFLLAVRLGQIVLVLQRIADQQDADQRAARYERIFKEEQL